MKQRLELTWIGKGEEDILEPRILIENPEYSYGDPDTGNQSPCSQIPRRFRLRW